MGNSIVSLVTNKTHSGLYSVKINTLESEGNLFHSNSTLNSKRGGFFLKSGKYVLSAWVSVDGGAADKTTFADKASIALVFNGNREYFYPSGNILDGWQRIYKEFVVPENVTTARFVYSGTNAYFDDLRIHPFNANMKSFVYDPITLRLVAELDENNYPTYYEYDKAGNLSHVKKVTEKGVQTVKEVRAGTVKKVQ